MAVTTLNALIKELDLYIRQHYIQHLTSVAPEFPTFTKIEAWPKNGDLFQPFYRKAQFPTVEPAVVKPEHAPVTEQTLRDGRTKDIYSVRFATSISFTYEKMKMGVAALSSAKRPAELLADAVRMTEETYFSEILANAINPSAPAELLCYDGDPLVSSSHTLLSGDSVSNYYEDGLVAADPTYTTLHAVLTKLARTVNEDNYPYPIFRLNTLFLPPEAESAAYEAIMSMGRPDTANRAENVLSARMTSSLSKASVKTLLWPPSTMWFGIDQANHEMMRYVLEAPEVKGPISDNRTHDVSWQVAFWLSRAVWDWRGVIGVLRP